MGAVLHDEKVGFLAASNSKLEHVADACTAEAFALRAGLLLASDLGCNKIIVNSDCMQLVEVMQLGGRTGSSAATI